MNQSTIEAPYLLGRLAKELVRDRLGIKPEQFKTTADSAWISLATRLVDASSVKPLQKATAKKHSNRRTHHAN